MTGNEIVERLQFLLKIGDAPIGKGFGVVIDKQDIHETIALIKRQQAEIEELNELYTNLKNATVQHSIDNEKDRQLLGEYQQIFLDLGYATEVLDPELKEIKAWKDRMLWHCKRADKLFTENNELKAEIERLKELNNIKIEEMRQERQEYFENTKKYRAGIEEKYEKMFLEAEAQIRPKAIKEFAEKLKEKTPFYEGWGYITIEKIDNLVKEMGCGE